MTILIDDEPRPQHKTGGLSSLISFATGSNIRAAALLIAVCLVAFLPGFFQVPPVDRDEARFAQATKQMIETGDYVDIRFQTETRYKKPVGIYWLQALTVTGAEAVGLTQARTTIWLYRLPSLLGAIGGVLLTYWVALAFVSRRAAVLAALMLAASLLLGVEARLAKTDAMLLASVLAAMGALARAYLADDREEVPTAFESLGLPAIFWTAIAGGIMLKGPLILLFVGVPMAALAIHDRSLRWFVRLRPLLGTAYVLVLCLPWFLAIVSRTGLNFFAQSLGQDFLEKVAIAKESHGAPPGTYFLLFFVTFWPAAPLAVLAAPAVWQAWREPGARFLLAWLVPTWIIFELAITKLPHYVLPLYPAIAILIAGVANSHALSRSRWLSRATTGWFLVSAGVSVLLIVGSAVAAKHLVLLAWPFAAASTIYGLLAWWLYEADGVERALLRAVVASILLSAAAFGVTFPALPNLFPSAMIAAALDRSECRQPMLATAAFQEPSIVFLAGTQTRFTDASGAADFLLQGECRFAAVDTRFERTFVNRAEAIGLRYTTVQRFEAFNISGGRQIALAIFAGENAP